MTTFERYFIAEKETHKEKKNCYDKLLEKEEAVDRILKEFGLDTLDAHIVNGYVDTDVGREIRERIYHKVQTRQSGFVQLSSLESHNRFLYCRPISLVFLYARNSLLLCRLCA